MGPRWPSLSGFSIECTRVMTPPWISKPTTLTSRPSPSKERKPGPPLTTAGRSVDAPVLAHPVEGRQRAADLRGTDHRHADRPGLAAAVADEHGVRGQHRDEPVHVALAGRLQEAQRERAALVGVGIEAPAVVGHAPAGAAEDLAAVGRVLADDVGDLVEPVVERLAQHEHGALVRGEALERDEERERHRLVRLDDPAASSSTSGSGSHEPT